MIDLNKNYKYWNSLMKKGVFQKEHESGTTEVQLRDNKCKESNLLSNPSFLVCQAEMSVYKSL